MDKNRGGGAGRFPARMLAGGEGPGAEEQEEYRRAPTGGRGWGRGGRWQRLRCAAGAEAVVCHGGGTPVRQGGGDWACGARARRWVHGEL